MSDSCYYINILLNLNQNLHEYENNKIPVNLKYLNNSQIVDIFFIKWIKCNKYINKTGMNVRYLYNSNQARRVGIVLTKPTTQA